ncbi:hypothetical protein [Fervidibacillus halotolerans]|uniref:DUF5643 domain-containing protein n=1 Tax=Fervidibacillus halotolerans TaxID=2980027 RepID=A0A9E8M047_9BACI|nr:hypothetical protein [Fervidibacillus halotolerans]WAA12784.1 hypothetical protein OE105_01160 [Fervidibacillus halotolerans]
MKRKWVLLFFMAILLVGGTFAATWAYFMKTFKSENNFVNAAVFDVDVVNKDGETIGDADFQIDEKLYPGMDTLEAYSFSINKNLTEVPMEYEVKVMPDGDLFPADGSSPVVLTLQREVEGNWENIDLQSTFIPKADVENLRILLDWPHSDRDTAFQGKTGNINLEVIARQIDGDISGPPYYSGVIEFKATPNGRTFKTSNKEITFYKNEEGYKIIEVSMGDGEGEFEERVGNFRVVESEDKGKTWYRVYTENEYYASEKQIWRVRKESVDTSEYGKLRFNATLSPYLLIESEELYRWFIKN